MKKILIAAVVILIVVSLYGFFPTAFGFMHLTGQWTAEEYHEAIAKYYGLHGKKPKAIKHFYKLTQIDPSRKDAYIDLALLYDDTNQFPKALETLQKGIDRASEKTDLCIVLGEMYLAKGHIDSAIDTYDSPGCFNEESSDWHGYFQGYAHFLKRDFDGAAGYLERVLQQNSLFNSGNRPNPYEILALSYYKQCNIHKADRLLLDARKNSIYEGIDQSLREKAINKCDTDESSNKAL
jgi:tetratricopeptide (TPR) repeat protein